MNKANLDFLDALLADWREAEEEAERECAECGGEGWMPPVGDFDMRRCPNGCPRP